MEAWEEELMHGKKAKIFGDKVMQNVDEQVGGSR
jgi:hypothetical protein